MKKICVSTYCEWSSYGSIMQSIGLKKTLQAMNCESFIVQDKPAPLAQRDFKFVISKNPITLVKNFMNLRFHKHKYKLYENSVRFINQNVDIRYYNDYDVLKSQIPEADVYIAGSDQIWHPDLCKPAFFLDFVQDKKRFSYAASMGVTDITTPKESEFQRLISKIDKVSVRENEMCPVIRKYTDKKINIHIDPTFLLTPQEWRTLERKYPVNKPYILVYAIYWDMALNRELKKIHKKTGYDILGLCPCGFSKLWSNQKIYDADPGQFLYLIDHAEAVVSSSFHGVAFSLIFNKKLTAVINPDSPSRIQSLLDNLDVDKRSITEIMNFDMRRYDIINNRIAREKERSVSYLKEILEYNE